jgi:hypothetical protein
MVHVAASSGVAANANSTVKVITAIQIALNISNLVKLFIIESVSY